MNLFLSDLKSGKLSGNSRKYNPRATKSTASTSAGASTGAVLTSQSTDWVAPIGTTTGTDRASAATADTAERKVTRLSGRKSTASSADSSPRTSGAAAPAGTAGNCAAGHSAADHGTTRTTRARSTSASKISSSRSSGSKASSTPAARKSSGRKAASQSGSSRSGRSCSTAGRSGGLLGAWRSSRIKGDEAAAGMARQDLQLRTFNSSIVTAAMFFALAGITLTTTGAYVYRSMQSNMVPYVVTVDTHGVVRSQGPVAPLTAASLPEEVITSQLCGFISDARLISKDKEVQREAVSHVFALLRKGSDVYRQLHQHYSQNNPMANTRSRSVRVEIANVIARGGSSYQIDWTEKSTDSDGIALPDRKMRAIISYELGRGESKDPSMVMLNPLNLYITEYTVSPVLA